MPGQFRHSAPPGDVYVTTVFFACEPTVLASTVQPRGRFRSTVARSRTAGLAARERDVELVRDMELVRHGSDMVAHS